MSRYSLRRKSKSSNVGTKSPAQNENNSPLDQSSARKAVLLGMPYGTAMARLRKMILFQLAQRLGEDNCFGCGGKIEKIEELSIEHKRPWEGISLELFWDLDNIAFSHLRCNTPHNQRGKPPVPLRIISPDGMSWCTGCRAFHDVSAFGVNRSKVNRNGLQTDCIKYRRESRRRKAA